MQQQIQSFLEDYFEKPEGSNIEGNKSDKSANPCGNGTTPSKKKDQMQERSKTKNLYYDSNNAKYTTCTEVQEMQIPIIVPMKNQTKHIDAHLLEAHSIASKSRHLGSCPYQSKKKNIKKAGSNPLYAHESGKENVQPPGIALLSGADTTNTRSVDNPQSRNSKNNSQKNQRNLSGHNKDNGNSMMDLFHRGHSNRAGDPFKCTCGVSKGKK
ncbi:18350_t:CDS:2 [Gigaspora rosea]|nr:18350_t:CDS:2 [Gigaspora rosea]